MKTTLKTWTKLGLATALAGSTLAACSDGSEVGEGEGGESAIAGEGGEGEAGEGESGESGNAVGSLSLPNRVAFMAGHVEAGMALYRAGDAEAAAPHLLHPVSEPHADERAGLEELGFDASLFEAVSKALEEGTPAQEIEPQLQAAQANLAAMREKAGGDPAQIITFLMETAVEEYSAAITDGKVSDPGEYQDAYGFAVVAKQVAEDLEGDAAAKVSAELDQLIGLFPDGGPIPPEEPAPAGKVSALASRVTLSLP